MANGTAVPGRIDIAINGGLAHAATKAGVIAMARQMAAEGAPHGIRANSISPGTIAIPSAAERFADEELLNSVLEPLLFKRLGQPEDVASLALCLASDESAYFTGSDFMIDGGLTAV